MAPYDQHLSTDDTDHYTRLTTAMDGKADAGHRHEALEEAIRDVEGDVMVTTEAHSRYITLAIAIAMIALVTSTSAFALALTR
jgi:hypothetical protein